MQYYTNPPKLRPDYQIPTQELILNAKENTCFQQPTGTGKGTQIADAAIKFALKGKQVLIVVPQIEILTDLLGRIKEFAPYIYQNWTSPINSRMGFIGKRKIYVATVGSVRKYRDQIDPQVVLHDECFIEGTLVDSKPIESYQIGDRINSWDGQTGLVSKQKIKHIFTNETDKTLVKVTFTNGKSFICTEDHPIYNGKWTIAKKLIVGDICYEQITERVSHDLFSLQNRFFRQLWATISSKIGEKCNLFSTLSICSFFGNYDKNEFDLCQRTNDYKKSDEIAREQRQSKFCSQIDKSQTGYSRREWKDKSNSRNSLSIDFNFFSRFNMATRKNRGLRETSPLQDRHLLHVVDASDRNKWNFSSILESARKGSEEKTILRTTRVQSVEIYKQGGTHKTRVYNFHIEKNHTYFAENALVHNCHHCRSSTWTDIFEFYPRALHLGFTATPIRYDGKSLRTLLPNLVVGNSLQWYIDRKYLAPFRILAEKGAEEFHCKGGYDNLPEQQKFYDKTKLIGDAVSHWERHAKGQKTIVFCTGEEHVHHVAEAYNSRFTDCAQILLSKTKNRKEVLHNFRFTDKHPVCVVVDIFTEGVNAPECNWVQLQRKTYSPGRYMQMMGRMMRYVPGKIGGCLDHAGNVSEHQSPLCEIDWHKLYYEDDYIPGFNSRTKFHTCEGCGADLIYAGSVTSINEIPCIICGHTNIIRPLRDKQKKAFEIEIEEGELTEYSASIGRQSLQRIVQSRKMDYAQKKAAILKSKALKDDKAEALRAIGCGNDAINAWLSIPS